MISGCLAWCMLTHMPLATGLFIVVYMHVWRVGVLNVGLGECELYSFYVRRRRSVSDDNLDKHEVVLLMRFAYL